MANQKTKYSPIDEINEFQHDLMVFIDGWVREKNTPVPRQSILRAFSTHSRISVEGGINALIRKGYIRRAVILGRKTSYVQLRNLHRDY